MKNLNVRTKIVTLVAIPLVAFLISTLVAIILLNMFRHQFLELAEESLPIVTALEEVKFNGSRIISSTNEFILDGKLEEGEEGEEGEEDEVAEIEDAVAEYTENLEIYRTLLNEDHSYHADFLSDIETIGQDLVAASDTVIELQESGAPVGDILEGREEFEGLETEFFNAVDAAIAQEREELLSSEQTISTTLSIVTNIFYVSIAGLLIFVSILMYLALQSIIKPLNLITDTIRKLQNNDLGARVEVVSTDEIGEIAQILNQMAEEIETRIVETEQARERAEKSDQVKSSFLASMSHELRTPLNAVINFTKFVAKGDLGPVNEDQRDTLYEVVDSAKHLLNLINDVLDMSKIESGSLNLFVVDDVDLNAIVNQAVSTGRILLNDKPVEIHTNVALDLPRIRGDRQRLVQILLNIMSNACKFTESGRITVDAYQEADEVVVAITDTGPGIAPEDQKAVFEPFKQTDSGLRKGGGTGLGMPITKNLVEAHGGQLFIHSRLHEGATFTVRFPVTADMLVPTLA